MIYFICGHKGCGKTHLAHKISQEIGCKVYDTGPIVRNEYKKSNSSLPFYEWVSENEKKYGEFFTNILICQNMEIDDNEITLIIGNRSLPGIEFITNYFQTKSYKVVYIDGEYELFRNNYNNREPKSLNWEDYYKIIDIENNMGIGEIERKSKQGNENYMYFYKTKNDESIYSTIIDEITKSSSYKKMIKEKRSDK